MTAQQHITTEKALQLIANRRRRKILQLLREDTDGLEFDDLVTELAEESSSPTGFENKLQRTRTELCHRHLPKLADHDVISYQEGEFVAPGPAFETAETAMTLYVERVEESGPTGASGEET